MIKMYVIYLLKSLPYVFDKSSIMIFLTKIDFIVAESHHYKGVNKKITINGDREFKAIN